MKTLVIGGGSMGRRRLRDLAYLGAGELLLFEPDRERCGRVAAAMGVEGFTRLDEALDRDPQAMVVSAPPAHHETYVREALSRSLHVFCELPFVLDVAALEQIVQQSRSYPAVLGVSHTIRYYPPFVLIRKILRGGSLGAALYFEYSLGNHLADWHPHEDYRAFYASGPLHEGASGGDMIFHEMAAIGWWMGPVEAVLARLSKVSRLEAAGPDVHDVLLWFADGCVGFFHHDIVERGTRGRHVRIVCEGGTVEWRQDEPHVRVYDAVRSQERLLDFAQAPDFEAALEASREMTAILEKQRLASGRAVGEPARGYLYESNYLREMRQFIGAVRGEHAYFMATLHEELQTLRTLHAILASASGQQRVTVGAGHADRA